MNKLAIALAGAATGAVLHASAGQMFAVRADEAGLSLPRAIQAVGWAIGRGADVETPEEAKPLEEFAEDRARYNALSEKACEGDEAAVNDLFFAAEWEESPTAMVSLAWLYNSGNCDGFEPDLTFKAELNSAAAGMGYPIGMSNFGSMLIDGEGIERNVRRGVLLKMRAAEGGYGDAGLHLAEKIADGPYFEKDRGLVKEMLQRYWPTTGDEALKTRLREKLGS